MSLRSDLIKLAHSDKTLRPHLLPMLKQAKDFSIMSVNDDFPETLAKALRAVGETRDSIGVSKESEVGVSPHWGDIPRGDFAVLVDLATGQTKRTDIPTKPFPADKDTRRKQLLWTRKQPEQKLPIPSGWVGIRGGPSKPGGTDVATSVYAPPAEYEKLQQGQAGRSAEIAEVMKDAMSKWLANHSLRASWSDSGAGYDELGYVSSGSGWEATIGGRLQGGRDTWNFRLRLHGGSIGVSLWGKHEDFAKMNASAVLKELNAKFLATAHKTLQSSADRDKQGWPAAALVTSGPKAYQAWVGFDANKFKQMLAKWKPLVSSGGTLTETLVPTDIKDQGDGKWKIVVHNREFRIYFSVAFELKPPVKGQPRLVASAIGMRKPVATTKLDPAGVAKFLIKLGKLLVQSRVHL